MFDSVATQGVSKAYDDEYALVNVTTQFTRGTSTALLGPNGAGKSTLVQMLCLLMRATEGAVLFDGHPADPSESEYRSRIGYLGHKTMLYRSLTARENLRFFAQIYGLSINEAELGDALSLVGLEYEADRAVSEYSRGMAQRLSIARVILHQPSLLLLDEPFTGLDQSGIRMAQDVFRREAERGAITIVVVTIWTPLRRSWTAALYCGMVDLSMMVL